MADFSCEPGKVLSASEAEAMLAYDNAGLARPDAYNDVVFDASGITGAVYRCKTADEKKRDEAAHKEEMERAERVAKLRDAARAEASKRAATAATSDLATEEVKLDPNATPVDDGEEAAKRTTGNRRGG